MTAERKKPERKRLTDRFVQSCQPPLAGRLEIVDSEAPGLTLRITSNGVRSWAIRYTPRGKQQRRASYGTYPAVSLGDARIRAKEIAAAAARGADLLDQEAKAGAEAKRAAEKEQQEAEHPATLSQLLDRYVEGYCKNNQRRWQITERMFENHVKPAIGNRPLAGLRRADIAEMLDDLQNKKGLRAQVNRVRAEVAAAINWGIERQWIETNPAAATKRRKIEAPRERVLNGAELRAIWMAAETLSDPSRALVKMLILTGQRRDEIRGMAWSEVDRPQKLWTLPAARNKGKRDHALPLAPAAMKLLDELPQLGSVVFTLTGEKPYAGTKRMKEILDARSGVTGWVLHDMRRTVRTGLAELSIAAEVAERIINHATTGLTKVYNVHTYQAEMRTAMEAWAERVAIIVGDGVDADHVVAFRRTI